MMQHIVELDDRWEIFGVKGMEGLRLRKVVSGTGLEGVSCGRLVLGGRK